MNAFTDYREARRVAQADANRFDRPMAIEKCDEYGGTVYRVKMLPKDPRQRFGWETRCEVVDPDVSQHAEVEATFPWIVRLTGRCANGAERDGGRRYHVVMTEGPTCQPGWLKALCGARPGRLSNGWMEGDGVEVPSCPRCRARAERLAREAA